MSVFVKYQNEVRVTTLDSGPFSVWRAVDLAPFLKDPTAIGVILRGTSATTPSVIGAREVSETFDTSSTIFPSDLYFETAVSLAGGTSVEVIQFEADDHVFIAGEIHGPDAVLYDRPIISDISEPDWLQWVDRQPTPQGDDVIGDINAVILRTMHPTGNPSLVYGMRQGPPGAPPLAIVVSSLANPGTAWWVIGLDSDGVYQTQTAGKIGSDDEWVKFLEMGYIKKTSKVVTVPNRDELPWVREFIVQQHPAFGTLDLSGTVPEDTIIAGILWQARTNPGHGTKKGYMRPTGSSENQGLDLMFDTAQTQMAGLNANRHCEYINEAPLHTPPTTLHWMYVLWYETEIAALPPGVPGIKQLNDDELLSANLTQLSAVSARLRQDSVVSVRELTSRPSTSIRRLSDGPMVSAGLN